MDDRREFDRQRIEEYRRTGGTITGPAAALPLLLLTSKGVRTGLPRTTLMMYIEEGDSFVVVASNQGSPKHPDWYLNVLADPRVTIELRTETFAATVVDLAGAAREEKWQWAAQRYPFLHEHQAKTRRQIPVAILERRRA